MSVTAISFQPGMNAQANSVMERAAAQSTEAAGSDAASASKQVHISFEPSVEQAGATPMDRVGSSLMDTLRDFEQTRANSRNAMNLAQGGPASPMAAAKAELLAGPAIVQPASGSTVSAQVAEPIGYDDAVGAMMRSFDYAIETQLIVKTGSQFSSSASSLMRGQ